MKYYNIEDAGFFLALTHVWKHNFLHNFFFENVQMYLKIPTYMCTIFPENMSLSHGRLQRTKPKN